MRCVCLFHLGLFALFENGDVNFIAKVLIVLEVFKAKSRVSQGFPVGYISPASQAGVDLCPCAPAPALPLQQEVSTITSTN